MKYQEGQRVKLQSRNGSFLNGTVVSVSENYNILSVELDETYDILWFLIRGMSGNIDEVSWRELNQFIIVR